MRGAIACVAAGICLGLLVPWAFHAAAAPNPGVDIKPPSAEQVGTFARSSTESPGPAAGYAVGSTWPAKASDPTLRDSLALAYVHAPLWREVADAAVSRGTTLRWGELPAEMNGQFSPQDKVITISSALVGEPESVVAATLTHEVYHASHDRDPGTGAALQEEINAFAWEAYVWSELPKGRAMTAREIYLDNLERMWRSRELNNFVVTMPGYQASLLGRVLVSP